MRDTIIAKALRCIDEAYPDAESIGEAYFPMEDFIDEVVRWVIDSVPTHQLTIRKYGVDLTNYENSDGVVYVEAEGDARVVYVKCEDWERPVFDVITEQSPLYRQQSNKVLRGNPSRPIVVRRGHNLYGGGYTLELYTTSATDETLIDIHTVPYDTENIPQSLVDLTAWKLAETVLMATSDVQAASVCTAKVNELLQQLSL